MIGVTGGRGAHNCEHCGMYHAPPCPRIKAIEHHGNGSIKRVGYFEGVWLLPGPKPIPDAVQARPGYPFGSP